MINSRRLTTAEAAARLGVKSQTLYAYVSRGLLDRERTPAGSSFDAAEVERLAHTARNAGGVARSQRPLAFVTELTLIEDGRLCYRGEDVLALSASTPFEAVADWLWTGREIGADDGGDASGAWDRPAGPSLDAAAAAVAALPAGATVLARLSAATVAAGAADPMRHDRSAAGAAVVGRQLLRCLVAALDPPGAGAGGAGGTVASGLGAALARRAGLDPLDAAAVDALRAALVLLADHELAASTLAVRVAASFGADPYAAVLSGLGASGGTRHGGASVAVHRLLRDAEADGGRRAVGDHLARRAELPGFGMALYPGGDPRGAALLARAQTLPAPAERRAAVDDVLEAVAGRGIPPANCDFGLGALAYLLGLDAEAGEATFVVARCAGWLAHAGEEYTSRTGFRVRAAYTGRRPAPR